MEHKVLGCRLCSSPRVLVQEHEDHVRLVVTTVESCMPWVAVLGLAKGNRGHWIVFVQR